MFNAKSKKLLIFFVIVIIVVLLTVFVFFRTKPSEKPWSVVYLTTGKIYIGKIVKFPKFQLLDAYLLRVVKSQGEEGETEENLQLSPVDETLWAPEKLYLNPKQIIFYGPIKETSKIAETIREAGK